MRFAQLDLVEIDGLLLREPLLVEFFQVVRLGRWTESYIVFLYYYIKSVVRRSANIDRKKMDTSENLNSPVPI
jgi:hypothetical protein